MSVQMMGAVIDAGPKKLSEFSVMLALANYADPFGWCFPSIETIAADSRCDERTVRRQITELEQRGWLHVCRKVVNGKSNGYILNLERLAVSVPGDARRSPLFMRLLKNSPGSMTPIFRPDLDRSERVSEQVVQKVVDIIAPFFAPEESADRGEISTDNPQGVQRTSGESQRTFEGGSPDIACPPNRYNHQSLNRHEPSGEVETTPTPPAGGVSIDALVIADPHHAQAWQRIQAALKTDLLSLGGKSKNFYELKRGENDFTTCFEQCWLAGIERVAARHWRVSFDANDTTATEAGLVKYAGRIQAYLWLFFPIPKADTITLAVRENRGSVAA